MIQIFTIQNFKSLLIASILLLALFLSACQTSPGKGYGSRVTPPSTPAQQSPNVLGAPATAQTAPMSMPQAQNLPPVKVAVLLPLSGQHKQLGDTMLKAAQMALFEIGHSNLELIPRDTKGTPDGARNAARSAVSDGAQLILGPVFAGSVRAAKSVTQSARVNMISFSTDWTLAGGNTYIMGFPPFDQIERVSAYAASRGITRAAVLSPDTKYGRVVNSAFRAQAPAKNIAITDTMMYPPATKNLAPIVRSLTRFNARESANALGKTPFDAVLLSVGGQDARAIGNLLTHYELPPRSVRRLGTGLFDEAALATESNLEGSWFAAPSPAARQSFERRFTSTYGMRPQRLSTLAYDATALAAVLARRGLQQSGKPAFNRTAIANPNGFSGVDGIFRFRSDNTAERGLAVLEFRKGKIVVVDEAPKTFQAPAAQAQTPKSQY